MPEDRPGRVRPMICVNCNTPIPEHSRYCLACGTDTSDPGTGPRIELNAASEHLFTQLRAAVVDRYDLKELLGRGGMGAVFLATDRKLERPVAIKVLPPELSHDVNVVERFEREARTAARLDHPNIIPIYSVESQGDFHYFVMKFVTGKSLEQILDAGPMPVDLVQRIVWEAACALGHAHQRGIVHRDIKPANIMIDESGRTILTDFGISKAVESVTHELTATGQVVGTPHYMSPEQSKGVNVDGRSDQYSLAVVAYRMLTGKLPFEEDTIHAVLYKKLFEEAPWIKDNRDDVPHYIAEALHHALAREPGHRFASMEAFATAIWPENRVEQQAGRRSSASRAMRSAIEGDTTELTPSAAGLVKAPPRRKRKVPLFLAGFVVIIGGAGGGWYYFYGQGDGAGSVPAAGEPIVAVAGLDSQSVAPATAESIAVDTALTVAESPPASEDREEQPQEPSVERVATPPAANNERSGTQRPVQNPTPQRPAEPQVGWLTVNSNPFGNIWIDNVFIQETPLFRHQLAPGKYVLEIRREGYQTVVDTISITAHNEVKRQKILVRVP
ncbi:MAG: protein kinase [Gemmatimonadota bacterium]|nr:MAG: protein kinase [Gemmatimonadota bacterium]